MAHDLSPATRAQLEEYAQEAEHEAENRCQALLWQGNDVGVHTRRQLLLEEITKQLDKAYRQGAAQAREELSFREFQQINLRRCRDVFFNEKDWTPNDWALAVAGEVGELCNLLKKIKRGDFLLGDQRQNVLRECADVFCYLDLLLSSLEADTGDEMLKKFDEVSDRYGYTRGDLAAALRLSTEQEK